MPTSGDVRNCSLATATASSPAALRNARRKALLVAFARRKTFHFEKSPAHESREKTAMIPITTWGTMPAPLIISQKLSCKNSPPVWGSVNPGSFHPYTPSYPEWLQRGGLRCKKHNCTLLFHKPHHPLVT